jgi:DNA-binding transcriptional LysR family regulator
VRALSPLLPEFFAPLSLRSSSTSHHRRSGRPDLGRLRHGDQARRGGRLDLRITRLVSLKDVDHRRARPSSIATADPSGRRIWRALPAIVFTQLPQPLDWRLRHPQEGERLVRVEPAYRFNNAAAVIPILTAGLAMAAQPEIFVRRELASGALETVLPDWTVAAIPIHALTPPAKTRPARVRC